NLLPLPLTFSLKQLKGKSVKEQIAAIMTARCRDVDGSIKKLTEEKAALEEGLEIQKRLDNPDQKEGVKAKRKNWKGRWSWEVETGEY
ncbi:hypothetical protein ACFLQR_02680, partial [Verrucomicrobiota bacterium]